MLEKSTLEQMLTKLDNLDEETIRVLALEQQTVRAYVFKSWEELVDWEAHQPQTRYYNYRILVVGTLPTDPKGFVHDIAPELYRGTHDGRPSDTPLVILPFESSSRLILQSAPAQERWDFMGELLAGAGDFVALILLVDMARPETFRESKSILMRFVNYKRVPITIAALNLDLPDGLTTSDARTILILEDIVPIVLYQPGHSIEVVKELLRSLLLPQTEQEN